MTEKILAVIERGKLVLATAREYVATVTKALIPAMAALALIVGTDSPAYLKIGSVLVALGVWAFPNVPRS
jgi:hypothetical protein